MYIREEFDNDSIFEFDIDFNIELTDIVTEENKHLDRSFLYIKDKATNEEIEQANEVVGRVVKEFATPTLEKLSKRYDLTIDFNKSRTGSSLLSPLNHNELSFAYYFDVHINSPILNTSEKSENKLSTFSIRIANHISPSELIGINNMNNVKIFHNYMINMYESSLSKYVNNIFRSYETLLEHIESYPNLVDNFSDIKLSDIQAVKKYAVQGNFPKTIFK